MFARVLTLLILSLCVAGCASKPFKGHTPADPEMLDEWRVEGQLKRSGDDKAKFFFVWTQLGETWEMRLSEKSVINSEVALIRNEGSGLQVRKKGGEWLSGKDAQYAAGSLLGRDYPFEQMAFWLRGLPAGANAHVRDGSFSQIEAMDEDGWEIKYKERMEAGAYYLPQDIAMKSDSLDAKLVMHIQRAEPGFISSWCPNVKTTMQWSSAEASKAGSVTLVPVDGSAPAPRWLNQDEFCAQLARVHGDALDPRAGLFGPDSMMWEINRKLAVPAVGAGRALLLQVSHPWITAGIDHHSEVRDDPMERARRTFSDMYALVFGSLPTAMATANKVHKIHDEITGQIPYEAGAFHKGSEYRANEISAMIWVNATLWDTLVRMYEKLERPLSREEKEKFYQETKLFAMLFGIPYEAMPEDWDDFQAYCRAMWESDQLVATDASRALVNELFRGRNPVFFVLMPFQKNFTAATLPPKLREGYELPWGWFARTTNPLWMFTAKVVNKASPGFVGNNPVYVEAMDRMDGEESSGWNRFKLKQATHHTRLVN